MATKKNDTSKRKSVDAKSVRKGKGRELSEKDLGKVSGGARRSNNDCKATSDTGMMGCSG